MKKILITALSAAAMIAGASSSFAQGQLIFANNSSSYITMGDSSTRAFGTAGTFKYGLYMGSAGTTAVAQMQLVDLVNSPTAASSTAGFAGILSGGTVVSPGNVANTLNFAAGTQYAFYVAGWSASSGADYLTALASGAGFTGISALGFISPTAPPNTIPNIFGVAAGQVGGFTMLAASTPEPATIAIGGLGAAALLMFRRRK